MHEHYILLVGILYNLALSPHESYFGSHAIQENAFETMVMIISFSHKELGVTQSLDGNVYKVVIYEGQVTLCYYFCAVHQVADRKFVYTGLTNEI